MYGRSLAYKGKKISDRGLHTPVAELLVPGVSLIQINHHGEIIQRHRLVMYT